MGDDFEMVVRDEAGHFLGDIGRAELIFRADGDEGGAGDGGEEGAAVDTADDRGLLALEACLSDMRAHGENGGGDGGVIEARRVNQQRE